MSKNFKPSPKHLGKRTIETTIGDLVAAAVDVAGGRPAAAAELLAFADFERLMPGRHLRFI